MGIRDFVANRSFSGNGLWQWYETPGYRVPRFYRRLGLVGGGKCLDSHHQQHHDTSKTHRLCVANCVTKSVDTTQSAKLATLTIRRST
jgi:hypothetical protein